MTCKIAARLRALDIKLPAIPKPSALYLPYAKHGDLIQLAGTISCLIDGDNVIGKLGHNVSLADGQRAARICALNLLAALDQACDGDLDRVRRIFMVRGFVNVTNDFNQMPLVINGASELFIAVFGPDIGQHARTAIGCASLPSGAAVEVDALVLIDDA
jgi:enamine deaminase RidA (YjgF/YER057c/UK114 family)